MNLKIENRETAEAYEVARNLLDRELPRVMLSAVQLAAKYELDNKSYTRRTGKLDQNTRGQQASRSTDEVTVEFVMDTEYASYVSRRGLTAFNEAGVLARDTIQDGIDSMRFRKPSL